MILYLRFGACIIPTHTKKFKFNVLTNKKKNWHSHSMVEDKNCRWRPITLVKKPHFTISLPTYLYPQDKLYFIFHRTVFNDKRMKINVWNSREKNQKFWTWIDQLSSVKFQIRATAYLTLVLFWYCEWQNNLENPVSRFKNVSMETH